jgi:hypothetical protein
MAKTLWEYYSGKGQKIPSIQDRSKMFEQYGLGSGVSYRGTAKQNTDLLNKLQAPTPEPKPVQPAPTATNNPAQVTNVNNVSSTPATNKPSIPNQIDVYGQKAPSNVSLLNQYREKLGLDTALKNIQAGQTKLLDSIRNAPKKYDIYKQEMENRGIDKLKLTLDSLDTRLAGMENAIYGAEGDIRKGITESGGMVTEDKVQRLVASESKPLIESYRKLLNERNRLADKISGAETSAKEMAGIQYEDVMRPLSIAEKELTIQKDQYSVLGDLLKQVYGASEKDVTNIINQARYGHEEKKQEAKDVIDRAIQMAQLSLQTPAGTSFKIGDKTVTGVKTSGSGSGGVTANMASEIRSSAVEDIIQFKEQEADRETARRQVKAAYPEIQDEIDNLVDTFYPAPESTYTPEPIKITARDFGAGVKDTFTQTIPNAAKKAYGGLKDFWSGLIGG